MRKLQEDTVIPLEVPVHINGRLPSIFLPFKIDAVGGFAGDTADAILPLVIARMGCQDTEVLEFFFEFPNVAFVKFATEFADVAFVENVGDDFE